jgi:hypothetical protein
MGLATIESLSGFVEASGETVVVEGLLEDFLQSSENIEGASAFGGLTFLNRGVDSNGNLLIKHFHKDESFEYEFRWCH